MNEETMRRHYETTPKEILINILISSREEVEKLQNRNKECKREIERLKEELKYTIPIAEHNKTITKHLKEIERLNNIINEFNKLIENEINESKLEEDYERVDAMEYCLATLRELKGSDKE